jgi:formate dehydrogenase
MLVAAHVVGIDAVYIYLRDEYHGCRELLTQELASLQANPPCPLPLRWFRPGGGLIRPSMLRSDGTSSHLAHHLR